jgi:hypothetical protein
MRLPPLASHSTENRTHGGTLAVPGLAPFLHTCLQALAVSEGFG